MASLRNLAVAAPRSEGWTSTATGMRWAARDYPTRCHCSTSQRENAGTVTSGSPTHAPGRKPLPVLAVDAPIFVKRLGCLSPRNSDLPRFAQPFCAWPHLICDGSAPLDVRRTLDLAGGVAGCSQSAG